MINRRQRTILILAAIVGTYAFLFQPMVDFQGNPLGWHFFSSHDVQDAATVHHVGYPDYGRIATEYLVLGFLTVCLYFGARPLRD